MKKSVKLISTVLVFAMLVSLCSCGKRESGRIKGSERSKTGNGVNDEIQGAFDLLTGAMGKDLDTVKARIKAYFGCELEENYYGNEDGYDEYIFDADTLIDGVAFNQVQILVNSKGIVYHVGFVNNLMSVPDLQKCYRQLIDRFTVLLISPSAQFPYTEGYETEYTEFSGGNGNLISTGIYYSADYNCLWLDCHNLDLNK